MTSKSLKLGIDIGGTNTKWGLVDGDGNTIARGRIKTNANDPFDAFAKTLRDELETFCLEQDVNILHVPIGVGAPNYCSIKERLLSPPNFSWGDLEIKAGLAEAFGRPIEMENDANVAAIGEAKWGSGKGLEDFVVITVGTGIGSGIYCNGQLLKGPFGLAGEAGHIIVEPGGRSCGCGGVGHLEAYSSVTGIKKTMLELLGREVRYEECIREFQAKNPAFIQGFQSSADHLAIGLTHIAGLLTPQRIILAGGGMVVGEAFLKMIKDSFEKHVYPLLRGKIEIVTSKLSTVDGAVLGAAALCP